MTPAGYSGTPLVRKLGLQPNQRVALLDAPAHFLELLGPLPAGVRLARRLGGIKDYVHLFAERAARLDRRLPAATRALAPDGMLWISWPKRSSGRPTDLTGGIVRARGLAAGLVDVKVCAVDEVWSALKFVYRVEDRPRVQVARRRRFASGG